MAQAEPVAAWAWSAMARPGFIDASEWVIILKAMEKEPARDTELARVVSYRRFQHDLARWRDGASSGDARQREDQTRELLASLPLHLVRRELTGAEALLLVDELASGIQQQAQADELRQAALQQLRMLGASQAAQSQADQLADQRKLDDYKQREAVVLQQWLAQPEAQRDQAMLDKRLSEARLAVYGRDGPAAQSWSGMSASSR
jgi:hypothetical protein